MDLLTLCEGSLVQYFALGDGPIGFKLQPGKRKISYFIRGSANPPVNNDVSAFSGMSLESVRWYVLTSHVKSYQTHLNVNVPSNIYGKGAVRWTTKHAQPDQSSCTYQCS